MSIPAAAFSKSPLFSALTGPQLDRLAALGGVCRFERGAVIVREGEPADAVYAVLQGHVEVLRQAEDGREIVLREIRAGEVAGELAVLHAGVRTATIVCRAQTECLRIDGRDFLALVHGDAAIAAALLAALSRRIAEMTEQMSDLAFLELPARVAKKILELAGAGDDPVRVSQQELARHLACSRESVNKHLRAFAARGWIDVGRNQVRILRAEPLRAFAGLEPLLG